jgi:hypothetical protein
MQVVFKGCQTHVQVDTNLGKEGTSGDLLLETNIQLEEMKLGSGVVDCRPEPRCRSARPRF